MARLRAISVAALSLGDKSKVTGGVAAEDVVVRGHIVGSVRGLRITLQCNPMWKATSSPSSLAIEQGAHFEANVDTLSHNPLAEIKAPAKVRAKFSVPIPRSSPGFRPRQNSEGLGGCC